MIGKAEKGLLINLFKKYLVPALKELLLWERLVNNYNQMYIGLK